MLGFDAVGRQALGQLPASKYFTLLISAGSYTVTANDAFYALSLGLSTASCSVSASSLPFTTGLTIQPASYTVTFSPPSFVSALRRPLYHGGYIWKGTL